MSDAELQRALNSSDIPRPDPEFVRSLRDEITKAAQHGTDRQSDADVPARDLVVLAPTVKGPKPSRSRKLPRLLVAAVVGLFVAVGLSTLRDGEANVDVATQSEIAERLFKESQSPANTEDRRLLLLAESVAASPNSENVGALGRLLLDRGSLVFAETNLDKPSAGALSASGTKALVVLDDRPDLYWQPQDSDQSHPIGQPATSSDFTTADRLFTLPSGPSFDDDGKPDEAVVGIPGRLTGDGTLAIGATSNVLTIYDAKTGEVVASESALGNFRGTRFSTDGHVIVVGQTATLELPTRLEVFDPVTGSFTTDHPLALNLPSARHVSFSPDGELVAAGYPDGRIQVMDTDSFALKETLTVANELTDVAFSADGTAIITGHSDGETAQVSLWSLETGEQILPPIPASPISIDHYRSDLTPRSGKSVFSTADGSSLQIWDIDPINWVEIACSDTEARLSPAEAAEFGLSAGRCGR